MAVQVQLVLQVQQVYKELQVESVYQEAPAIQAAQVQQAFRANLAFLEIQELLAFLVVREQQDRLAHLALQGQQALQVFPDRQDQWELQDLLVLLDFLVIQEQQAVPVCKVHQVYRVGQDIQVFLGLVEPQEQMVLQELLVHRDFKANPVVLARRAHLEIQVPRDSKDCLVLLVGQVLLASKVLQDFLDFLVQRVQPEIPVHKAARAVLVLLVPLVLLGFLVLRVPMDFPAHRVDLVLLEVLERPDLLAFLAFLAIQEQWELKDGQALQVHLDFRVCQEILVQQVYLELQVVRSLAHQVPLVLRELAALSAPLVLQA